MSIQEHLNKIRNAIKGSEVRESIAKGIETAYDDASEKDNANMEVKIARGTNPNLNTRLNKMDATDSQNTKKIDSNYQEVTAQLAQTENNKVDKDGSQQVKWANIAQDAREQISGDKVAVVGEDSVGTENLTDNAVTYDKTDFADEVSVRVINLIKNGNFSKDEDNDGIADGFIGRSNVTQPRIENNTQYWTPLSTTYAGSISSDQHTFLKDHTYYIKADITNVATVSIRDPENEWVNLGVGLREGNWVSTFNVDEETTSRITFYTQESNVESSISNLVVVDLTATFGFGKELDAHYFEFLLQKAGGKTWFDVVNLTDFSKRPIMSARDLDVYDPENELPANNVNDNLKEFNKGRVVALRGKNLYNSEKNVEGTIKAIPAIPRGFKQEIDKDDNPRSHLTQKIRISNGEDITLSNVDAYSITDLSDRVVVARTLVDGTETTISTKEIPFQTFYLWVSVREEDVGSAQVEMGSEATRYEPYTPVKAVYANGVKLFDFPFSLPVEGSDTEKKYELARVKLGKDEADELFGFLMKNAQISNTLTYKATSDSQVIPLTDTVNKQKMILHLHKRENDGYDTKNDVYLPKAENDFSDVRIIDDKGNVLPYRTSFKTEEFDLVADYRLATKGGKTHTILSDGKGKWVSLNDAYISESVDDGKTWNRMAAFSVFKDARINLIADDGTFYFNHGGTLYRSEVPYTSYDSVFDLEHTYPGTLIQAGSGMVQHPDGELFFGAYQNKHHILVYKSSDNGLTWENVLNVPDKYQHVHAMHVDRYQNPPAVYAGVDAGGGVYKTTNKGESWVDLREKNPNMPQTTDFGVTYSDPSGYRLLGGETAVVGGHSIIKTTDDVNFRPVLSQEAGVTIILKMGDKLFAGGAGTNSLRAGLIYVSNDEGETWEQVYSTGILSDTLGANDGFRHLADLGSQIVAINQSASRPPVRILPEGKYAEIIIEVPEGTTALTVESGHAYPNQMPIVNDSEFLGEKLIYFELVENALAVKELVTGKLFQDNLEWIESGKHLSYFYPPIVSSAEKNSVLLKTLSGYEVDTSHFDVSEGVTVSFWARLSNETRFTLLENASGSKLEIVNGYQLHLNGSNIISFGAPILPDTFIKYDLWISNTGLINVYHNGQLRNMSGSKGVEILDVLDDGGQFVFLRNVITNDKDAMQHFVIRKGLVSAKQLLAEYNAGITDNY